MPAPPATLGLHAAPSAWEAAVETLTFRAGWNSAVVLAGVTMLGVAAGAVGAFAMLRRRALMGDVLAHATLPGVAGAFLLGGWLGLDARAMPLLLAGAAITGALGVALSHTLARSTRLTEDAAMACVLGSSFGLGAALLTVVQAQPTGGAAGLNHLLLGNAAAMLRDDAATLGVVAAASLGVILLVFKELRAVCFDRRFAQAQGWPTGLIDAVLMATVVLVTVAGLQTVGIVLIVALLIIPGATARLWSSRLATVAALAGAFGGAASAIGVSASSAAERVPTGAAVVLAAGALFILSLAAAPRRGIVAVFARRARLAYRIARDHVLREAYEEAEARGRPPAPGDPFDYRRVARRAGLGGWRGGLLLALMRLGGRVARAATGAPALTARGVRDAERVTRAHRLIEEYLIRYADMDVAHAHAPADLVEHTLSDQLIAQLERRLAAPNANPDPHAPAPVQSPTP